MTRADFRSGFVAILGKPNTGKSTLLNQILGEKISITSPKPQTTRNAIKGILNRDDCQIVFIDTPGYLEPRYEMQHRMRKIWSEAWQDVDLILFLTDVASFPTDYDLQVMERLSLVRTPQLAVFNKIDLKPDVVREHLTAQLPASLGQSFFVSARTGEQVPELMTALLSYIPYHEPYFQPDQLSDLPLRFFAQETIREAIFHQLQQEIPYAAAVLVQRWQDEADKTVIDAVIWVEKPSQKIILIGSKGEGLAQIRRYAESRLSEWLERRVLVHLWVKVNPGWRKKSTSLKELGLG